MNYKIYNNIKYENKNVLFCVLKLLNQKNQCVLFCFVRLSIYVVFLNISVIIIINFTYLSKLK